MIQLTIFQAFLLVYLLVGIHPTVMAAWRSRPRAMHLEPLLAVLLDQFVWAGVTIVAWIIWPLSTIYSKR